MSKFESTIKLQQEIRKLANETSANYTELLTAGVKKYINEILSELNSSNWEEIFEVVKETTEQNFVLKALTAILKFLRDPAKLVGLFDVIDSLFFKCFDQSVALLYKRIIIERGEIKNSGISFTGFLEICEKLSWEDENILMMYGLPEYTFEEHVSLLSNRDMEDTIGKKEAYSEDVKKIIYSRINNYCKKQLAQTCSNPDLYILYCNLHSANADESKNQVLKKVLDLKMDFSLLIKWQPYFLRGTEVPISTINYFFDQLIAQSLQCPSRMGEIKRIMKDTPHWAMREELSEIFKQIEKRIQERALQLI